MSDQSWTRGDEGEFWQTESRRWYMKSGEVLVGRDFSTDLNERRKEVEIKLEIGKSQTVGSGYFMDGCSSF